METETETKERDAEVKDSTIITANMIKAIYALGIYSIMGAYKNKFGTIIIDLSDPFLVKSEIILKFSSDDIKDALKILQDIGIFPENVIFK